MVKENKIRPKLRRRIRYVTCLLGAGLVTYCLLFVLRTPNNDDDRVSQHFDGLQWHPTELLNNLSLAKNQCEAVFPGLTWSIDDVVAQGPFQLKSTNSLGPLVGRIKDGKLYIITAQRKVDISAEMLNSRTASLHQIHRALLTSPPSEQIPDTIFALNFQDQPFGTAWSYSRHADATQRLGTGTGDPNGRTFLMPHFSFWAWRLPFIGSMQRAASAIDIIETQFPSLSSKIPKAIWRGTTWFNSVHNPGLRANLMQVTKDKPWADVQALKWDSGGGEGGVKGAGDRTASNALAIEDFCRYRYILHTEGVTYSGRFQFLQMCASVVITPPIGWMQHITHMVKPLFSNTLDFKGESGEGKGELKRWQTSARTQSAWPIQYAPEEANIVFVAPDWSDLEETIAWLEAHPKIAEGIARRQRELFVGGGYFSPAAETCYWRALIRGWNKVVRLEEEVWDEIGEGERYEAFVLTNGN